MVGRMKYNAIVKPGSFKDEVVITENNSIIIKTRKRAHDGEANVAVIELLAKHFHVPKTSITILHGATSRKKLILLPSP